MPVVGIHHDNLGVVIERLPQTVRRQSSASAAAHHHDSVGHVTTVPPSTAGAQRRRSRCSAHPAKAPMASNTAMRAATSAVCCARK